MLNIFVVLRYVLQLLGFAAKEFNNAEQQNIGQEQQQLRQSRVDLDAIQKANQAAATAVGRFRTNGVQ